MGKVFAWFVGLFARRYALRTQTHGIPEAHSSGAALFPFEVRNCLD